jgi:hypothetical protein
MNNDNNYAMLGINSDNDNLFDFEAASSNTFWPGTHTNPGHQTEISKAEEAIHVMPLTKSEVEAIVAARASNAQSGSHVYSLAPPELNTNFSGFEEPSAYGASFNYDGAESLIPTYFNDLDMPDYGNAPPNAMDGFGTFEQPQFQPADLFGAFTDCALRDAVDQSE